MGLVSFPLLGIDADPNIDVPSVSVTVTQPGADPAELETQVTEKIEDAVAGLGNIDHILSTVDNGFSNTVVNFVIGTDSDRATNDVRNAVAQIRSVLPQDINDPVVERVDFVGGAIMSYAVVSPSQSVEQLSDLVDQTITRSLLAVPGISQVQRIGGIDRLIRVDLDPTLLESVGITATQVNEQLRNFNINLPGGRTNIGDSEQTIRILGSADSVDQLRNYQINLPQGGFVPLSSLGTVKNGAADVRQAAYLDGKPVVAFSILRSTGSTLVTVEEGVRQAVDKLQQSLSDVRLELIYTEADFIRESYQASIDALVLGAALAVITILIFLRDWRATLITAIALPLSIIPTFAVLKALGYTLNSMTLLALALVVGILVDDAIVEIENIERHMQMGKPPFRAALDASGEIGLAVVATSMTIVSVFVPIAFISGIPGQFFRPFAVTVAASVLFSLLVARTLTPLMAAYWLKGKDLKSAQRQDRFYQRLLKWSLRHRLTTLAIALVFFVASLLLVPYIPTNFIDQEDRGLSLVTIELPPGSSLEQTNRAVQQATQLLEQSPAVTSVLATEGTPVSNGGMGSSSGADVNTAKLYVKLKPDNEREGQQQFEEQMRSAFQQIPGVHISFSQAGVGGDKPLSIVLKSENADTLTATANTLVSQMSQIPGIVEAVSSASLVQPEILINPLPTAAADQGVSVEAIAQTALIATIGANEDNLAKFNLPDRQIPILVELAPRYRNDLDTIKNLQVPGENGLVPLTTVADVSLGSGIAQIHRYDRSREVTVDANLQGITLGDAYQAVQALPVMNLPPGVEQETSGETKVMQDVFSGFAIALLTGVLFIYAVLVLLFRNFLHPITIMAALPLSLGGALIALLIAQKSLGLYALIGIVLLMGIVTKNSILLVDYALLNQQSGQPLYKATVESGLERVRPILMTTIAMVAGMLPIALGIGAGSAVRSPMAIAVVGGLLTATLLTLVVIPVVFTYMDGFQIWLFKRLRLRRS